MSEEERRSALEASAGLRDLMLQTSREEVNLPATQAGAPVWGVLMEMGRPKTTVTVLGLSDGTASLYFSSGGGFLGGHFQPAIRHAGIQFCETANQYLDHFRPVQEYPYPPVGSVTFYLRTDDGTLAATAPMDLLADGGHPLSPLYEAGQAIITEYRLYDQAQERARRGENPLPPR